MMNGPEKSDSAIVCAGQRVVQEGSSPSGARMRGVISERGGNASRAGERRKAWSSQSGHEGECREIRSGDLSRSSRIPRRAGCPPRGGIRRA